MAILSQPVLISAGHQLVLFKTGASSLTAAPGKLSYVRLGAAESWDERERDIIISIFWSAPSEDAHVLSFSRACRLGFGEDALQRKHLSGGWIFSWRLGQVEVSCQLCAILPLWSWDWTVNVFVYLAEMQRGCLCLSQCVFNEIFCQYFFHSFFLSICHSFCLCPHRILLYLLWYPALFLLCESGSICWAFKSICFDFWNLFKYLLM